MTFIWARNVKSVRGVLQGQRLLRELIRNSQSISNLSNIQRTNPLKTSLNGQISSYFSSNTSHTDKQKEYFLIEAQQPAASISQVNCVFAHLILI